MSLATKLLSILGSKRTEKNPYWLEISTKVPKCIYFFGPFDSPLEAKGAQAGYIEDLMSENSQGIHLELKQCSQPPELTICELEVFE